VKRILVATDAFPPVCGGSGWSTWELARGLRERGHEIVIVQPVPGLAADEVRTFDGFTVDALAMPAPGVPFVRNYFKNERLWQALATRLERLIVERQVDIVQGQHVLTSPAAVRAAARTGRPVVCTIRDYWPVCYWGTLIHDPEADHLCPACSAGAMTKCIRPRAGAAWPLALPAIPYMRGNLARKQAALADADAIVAVSHAIARDLEARAPGLSRARIEVIPNPVNVAALDEAARSTTPRVAGDYAVFVGKLEINKGVQYLLPAVDRAALPWPLVVVGDGAERAHLESQARQMGRDVRFTGWLARDEALACLAHASMLVFPSHGPESLSRVLLEAAALGVPIAAMDTGGTGDIVRHGSTGLLAPTPDALAGHVATLAGNRDLGRALADAARVHVEQTFATPRVAAAVDALYDDLLAREGRARG
jgi:glycosyltransferase involved in cell wall biosynthesis